MDNGQIENNVGGSVPHTRRGTDPNLVRSRLIESIIERDGILIMADRVNPIVTHGTLQKMLRTRRIGRLACAGELRFYVSLYVCFPGVAWYEKLDQEIVQLNSSLVSSALGTRIYTCGS
jgi:hypothetical protein